MSLHLGWGAAGLGPQQRWRPQKNRWCGLEQRWREADATVAGRRDGASAAAHQRVVDWSARRSQGRAKVDASGTTRAQALEESLRAKEARVRVWQSQREQEERVKCVIRAAAQADAAKRFTQGVQKREALYVEAQQRAAQRQNAMAALKRVEMDRRAERSEQRQLKNVSARIAVERELQARITHTEERIRRRELQLEAFQQQQQQQQQQQREATSRRRGDAPTPRSGRDHGHQVSPRFAQQQQQHKPSSARRTKQHDGVSGLEQPSLKCALCEQEFAQLSGGTFLKAVGTKRAEFGDDTLLRWCEKRGLNKMYESASLCVFCCQFFHQSKSQEKGVPGSS